MKRYRVSIHAQSNDTSGVVIEVRAEDWAAAVSSALAHLTEVTHPEDRDGLQDSTFQVVDIETGRENVFRSLAEIERGTLPLPSSDKLGEALQPNAFSAEQALMRAQANPGHSHALYVRGRRLGQQPGASEARAGDEAARPASDLRRTLDDPPRYRRSGQEREAPVGRAMIRSERLKPKGRNQKKRVARGEFEPVRHWQEPDAGFKAICSEGVAMAWGHIHCETMQVVIPLPQSGQVVVAASAGEWGDSVVGARCELPLLLKEALETDTDAQSFPTAEALFVYERRNGTIVSFAARCVLWNPIRYNGQIVAVMMAVNPTRSQDFAAGDVNGAVYLSNTLAQRIASYLAG